MLWKLREVGVRGRMLRWLESDIPVSPKVESEDSGSLLGLGNVGSGVTTGLHPGTNSLSDLCIGYVFGDEDGEGCEVRG